MEPTALVGESVTRLFFKALRPYNKKLLKAWIYNEYN